MQFDDAITGYAGAVGYAPRTIEHQTCSCGSDTFMLFGDETEGGAFTICTQCETKTDLLDSEQYVENCVAFECTCEAKHLQIAVAVAYYEESDDPRWVYVGGRCPTCELAGVYIDWQER